MFRFRSDRFGSLAAALGMLCAASAQAAEQPAAHYVRGPVMSHVVPSPSGQRLAIIMTLDSGRRAAAVLELPPRAGAGARAVAAFGDADVTSVAWVNDNRLVVEAFQPGVEVRWNGAGTFAVDHDGSNLRQLVAWRSDNVTTGTRIQERTLTYGWFLDSTLDDGSDDVLMQQRQESNVGTDEAVAQFARLNTRTGFLRSVSRGMPDGISAGIFDNKGELRVVRQVLDGRDRLFVRQPGTETYSVLRDVPALRGEGLQPRFLEADGQLIVNAYAGRDTVALHALDLKTRQLDPEPLVRLDRYDVRSLETDAQTQAAVGAHLVTDRPQSVWFSPRLAAIQTAVDAALPAGRFNRILCGRCETSSHYVVWSSSDRLPGEYLLYDHAGHALTSIGKSRPWLDETTQGARTFHWVKARDGMSLPLVVTHPAGSDEKSALPAVVLVHGGPWVRGVDRGWSEEAQFLASRGFRVIEPDFRGSLGYGWRHFQAGWKEWGRSMQDDLADAADWAANQGLIDRDRVCIYGASYGGYAALMAPIRHPGVYRCAASFVGVTDIQLMYSSSRSDFSHQSKRYTMPELIGDPVGDADRLKAASPVERAAEIKVPVLLAHGLLDRRVPREHASKFESAARAAGVRIERVNYADEAHGWNHAQNHADFLERLSAFISASLRPRAPAAP